MSQASLRILSRQGVFDCRLQWFQFKQKQRHIICWCVDTGSIQKYILSASSLNEEQVMWFLSYSEELQLSSSPLTHKSPQKFTRTSHLYLIVWHLHPSNILLLLRLLISVFWVICRVMILHTSSTMTRNLRGKDCLNMRKVIQKVRWLREKCFFE